VDFSPKVIACSKQAENLHRFVALRSCLLLAQNATPKHDGVANRSLLSLWTV